MLYKSCPYDQHFTITSSATWDKKIEVSPIFTIGKSILWNLVDEIMLMCKENVQSYLRESLIEQ